MNLRNRDDIALILIHARTLQLTKVTCEQLRSRGVDLAHHLGYHEGGIVKGSPAARVMSNESKQGGGYLRSLELGGISASFQSVGACCLAKRLPMENIRQFLSLAGLLRPNELTVDGEEGQVIIVQIPSYWKSAAESLPRIYNEYRKKGLSYGEEHSQRIDIRHVQGECHSMQLSSPQQVSFGQATAHRKY